MQNDREIEAEHHESIPYRLLRRIVTLSAVCGLVGGLAGGFIIGQYLPDLNQPGKQARLLQESTAAVQVAEKVTPSVVSISTESTGISFFGRRQTQEGAGTGIIVSRDGLILTNNHVIQGAQNLTVFDNKGKEYKNAKVVARDAQNDIAFIKIDASGLEAATLGDSSKVKVGTKVVAIGNALGMFQNTVTEGIISGKGRPVAASNQEGGDVEQLQNLFQTDAAINPGNSGGPLVDLSGQVIGINTAVAGDAQSIGFAIPINLAKRELESVEKQGRIVRPYLGVRYIPITKEFASSNNLPVSEGAYITGDQNGLAVLDGSPAQEAGFKEGDILTKFGDQKINRENPLSTIINEHKVGDKVKVAYLRDGQEQVVEVTLKEAPQS